MAFLGLLVWWIEAQSEKEIALVIGEPWEDMRQRSSASIGPAIAGSFWGRLPDSDARLRFTDPQYGFVTPVARYLAVTFTSTGLVSTVRMSPQIEPLLLDDIFKVVLDLQEQWRNAGWVLTRPDQYPALADTPQSRAKFSGPRPMGTTYWQAGDLYQVMMSVRRFKDDKRPTEDRYLITLSIAEPWMKP
nr:hypothetical protein [Pseudomonas sp. Pse1]